MADRYQRKLQWTTVASNEWGDWGPAFSLDAAELGFKRAKNGS